MPNTFRLGTYRPVAGYHLPVFLTIQTDLADFLHSAESVSALADAPFLLLAPTAQFFTGGCQALLAKKGVRFISLEDAMFLDPMGRWVLSPHGLTAMSEFRRSALPAENEAPDVAFFPTPPNAKWSDVRIRFVDGETVVISVLAERRTATFAEMGLANRRAKTPTVQWDLLRSFAKGRGFLTRAQWRSHKDPKAA